MLYKLSRQIDFEDTEVTVLINSKTNALIAGNYVERKYSDKGIQSIPDKSEHFVCCIDEFYFVFCITND